MPSMKTQIIQLSKPLTDEQLMEELAAGGKSALNELMKRYKHKLYPFILHYVRDDDLAYDLLQDVFIKVFTKAGSYSSKYRFSTWVYRIAINTCHDWSRKNKLKNIFSFDSLIGGEDQGMTYHDVLPSKQSNVEDIIDQRKQLLVLGEEIPKLPHKLRVALILFALEGYSQDKCATILGVTVKTIEMRVYRARKILFEKVSKKFEG